MVSLALKVLLHVAENDSKYRDVAPLINYEVIEAFKNHLIIVVFSGSTCAILKKGALVSGSLD